MSMKEFILGRDMETEEEKQRKREQYEQYKWMKEQKRAEFLYLSGK